MPSGSLPARGNKLGLAITIDSLSCMVGGGYLRSFYPVLFRNKIYLEFFPVVIEV